MLYRWIWSVSTILALMWLRIVLFKEYQNRHPYCRDLKDEIPYLQAIVDRQKVSNSMRVLWKNKS